MGSLLLPAHSCRLTGVGIADSAMPYTYRSISPDTRIRNGKDFHSPIKSRNFVLTVFHDGVRSPPSVSFLVGFGQKPSQPKDRCRLYRDFRTQIPSVPVYLFALHFRHEVLHGESAASDCQPFFVTPAANVCRRSLLTIQHIAEYHSHPLAARMTLVFLHEDESFVQRLSVPFIFVLNGLPLSVPGTLLPIVAVTRLQLFRIKTLLPTIKFWYLFCIPQT